MKKIFTFLLCTSFFAFAVAQKAVCDANTTAAFYSGLPYDRGELIKERNIEIAKVNEQNSIQVEQAIENCDFDIWQKKDILNNLETDRINRIRDVYLKYSTEMAYYNYSDKANYKTSHFNYER